MKIVIAGAGAVGTHLAKLLSQENHDITLIDDRERALETLGASYDIMTVNDSPMSIQVLKETVKEGKTDLFIAVTPDEAHNITCCMLAHQMGAKKTVARVDNPEYDQPEQREFFRQMGIQSIIYPEKLAGEEISNNIRRSWIRQWCEVQEGKLVMLGVKVRNGAPIINEDKPLKDICGPDDPFHIVAIKRGGDTIIPHGNDFVRHQDLVYFMTTLPYVSYIRKIAGKEDYPDIKNTIIMGGSDTAVQAINCMPDSMHIKLIEEDAARCKELLELVKHPHTLIIHGDGRDLDLLADESVERVHAFAALTNNSEQNILACLATKRIGVRKTVAVVENTDYIPMAESLDIGSIINKKTFAASHIYRMLLKADITTVKTLTVANADVAEFSVRENARITKAIVRKLQLPENVTLGGLVRGGRGILINGNTQILPGDRVVAFCLQNNIKKLAKFF